MPVSTPIAIVPEQLELVTFNADGLVPAIDGFLQQEPIEGAPTTEPTEAWIFFDDDTLYVSARCWVSEPERMVVTELRRDMINISQNENFVVIFDTFLDRRNGVYFQTTPAGAVRVENGVRR